MIISFDKLKMRPDLGKSTFLAHQSGWYNHPYVLGKRSFGCATSQEEGLMVALSKCVKEFFFDIFN